MKRSFVIDLAKFIAALLVIAIHTALFVDVNKNVYFVFNELICRLAVPFFAICTGYYLSENDVKSQWVKIVRIYIVWTILYFLFLIPNWISTGWLSLNNCLGYCKSAILTCSYFHLWYLLYMIYALPIFWICKKSLGIWGGATLALILWTFNAFVYGYQEVFLSTGEKISAIIHSGYAVTEAQFCILPMLLTGSALQRANLPNKFICWLLIGLSLMGLCIEGVIVKSLRSSEVSYIFMILPATLTIFAFLQKIQWNPKNASKLLNYNLVIYCIHPMFCRYIKCGSSIIDYICICLLSIIAAYSWDTIKKRFCFHANW